MAEYEPPGTDIDELIRGLTPEQVANCWVGGSFVIERFLSIVFGEEVKLLNRWGEEAGYAPNTLRVLVDKQNLPVIRVKMDPEAENSALFMRRSDLEAYQKGRKPGRGPDRRQTLG